MTMARRNSYCVRSNTTGSLLHSSPQDETCSKDRTSSRYNAVLLGGGGGNGAISRSNNRRESLTYSLSSSSVMVRSNRLADPTPSSSSQHHDRSLLEQQQQFESAKKTFLKEAALKRQQLHDSVMQMNTNDWKAFQESLRATKASTNLGLSIAMNCHLVDSSLEATSSIKKVSHDKQQQPNNDSDSKIVNMKPKMRRHSSHNSQNSQNQTSDTTTSSVSAAVIATEDCKEDHKRQGSAPPTAMSVLGHPQRRSMVRRESLKQLMKNQRNEEERVKALEIGTYETNSVVSSTRRMLQKSCSVLSSLVMYQNDTSVVSSSSCEENDTLIHHQFPPQSLNTSNTPNTEWRIVDKQVSSRNNNSIRRRSLPSFSMPSTAFQQFSSFLIGTNATDSSSVCNSFREIDNNSTLEASIEEAAKKVAQDLMGDLNSLDDDEDEQECNSNQKKMNSEANNQQDDDNEIYIPSARQRVNASNRRRASYRSMKSDDDICFDDSKQSKESSMVETSWTDDTAAVSLENNLRQVQDDEFQLQKEEIRDLSKAENKEESSNDDNDDDNDDEGEDDSNCEIYLPSEAQRAFASRRRRASYSASC